jgi:hypothetical protein
MEHRTRHHPLAGLVLWLRTIPGMSAPNCKADAERRRALDANEIVIQKMQRHRVRVIGDFPTERVGQPGQSAAVHPDNWITTAPGWRFYLQPPNRPRWA